MKILLIEDNPKHKSHCFVVEYFSCPIPTESARLEIAMLVAERPLKLNSTNLPIVLSALLSIFITSTTGGSPGAPPEGALGDIAPTILDIMGIDKPDEMTGTSLFIDKN